MPDLKDSKETFYNNYKTRHQPPFINEFQHGKDFNMPLIFLVTQRLFLVAMATV